MFAASVLQRASTKIKTQDFSEAEKELKGLISEVNNGIQDMSIGQIDFQKKVGRIEVLGELLIEHK